MLRRGLLCLSLLAGVALSACATTYTTDEYDDVHDMLLAATQERDESLMREEGLRNQVSQVNAQYQRLLAEGQANPAELARLQQEAANAQSKLAAAEQARHEAAASARSYAAEVERLRQEAIRTPTIPDNTAEMARLNAEVVRLRAMGKIVSLTPDGNIEIVLPSDVTFSSGEATLTKRGQQSLRTLSTTLNGEYAPFSLRVEGHTDSQPLKRTRPIWGDNRGLGSARALSVVRFMESDMRIELGRLASSSHGMHQPLADNKSKADRAKNRRVSVIVVIPKDQALTMAK